MDKCRINIAVIEPSTIIYEGLSNILLHKGRTYYKVYHLEDIEDISTEIQTLKIDLVIANPSMLKNYNNLLNYKVRANRVVPWVALVYSFFEKGVIDSFDAIIQITDSPEAITLTVQNLIYLKCQSKAISKEHLSRREIDVLKCLVQGLSNKEIAAALNISIHTVISHRKNIVQKTGIKSQSGLTIYAISNNIINIKDYQR